LQHNKSELRTGIQATDRSYLLLNPNFTGLIDAIQHKAQSKPELGRILTDLNQNNQKFEKKKKELALFCFVKSQTAKEQLYTFSESKTSLLS
jgi:hypothetical protein